MRKLALILFGLFVCLFCNQVSNASVSATEYPVEAAFAFEHNTPNQWICERVCNSDMGLTRVLVERVPVAVNAYNLLRDARSIIRMGIHCGVAGGRVGNTVHAVAEFENKNLSAGVCAIDYYVYRLRRLII